jgi:hypothetical protein
LIDDLFSFYLKKRLKNFALSSPKDVEKIRIVELTSLSLLIKGGKSRKNGKGLSTHFKGGIFNTKLLVELKHKNDRKSINGNNIIFKKAFKNGLT